MSKLLLYRIICQFHIFQEQNLHPVTKLNCILMYLPVSHLSRAELYCKSQEKSCEKGFSRKKC